VRLSIGVSVVLLTAASVFSAAIAGGEMTPTLYGTISALPTIWSSNVDGKALQTT